MIDAAWPTGSILTDRCPQEVVADGQREVSAPKTIVWGKAGIWRSLKKWPIYCVRPGQGPCPQEDVPTVCCSHRRKTAGHRVRKVVVAVVRMPDGTTGINISAIACLLSKLG